MNIVATTMTSFGQIIDWTVPTEDALLEVPPPPQPLEPLPEGFVYAKSPLETEPDARGPAGTVPHVRPDIDGLLEAWGDKLPDDPERIFDIMPTPNPDVNSRYHAGKGAIAPSSFPYKGLEGRVSLWKVPQRAIGDTSIMQTWLGSAKDTIESGKYEWSGIHSGAPHFFVFFTNNYYTQAPTAGYCDPFPSSPNSGGFVTGFAPWNLGYLIATATNWPPDLVFSDLNMNPGQVIDMVWEKGASSGVWYLYVNGELAGQFNATCIVGAVNSGVSATMWHPTDGSASAGLRTAAPDAQWYGEVLDSAAVCSGTPVVCTGATTTDMGNGQRETEASPAWIDHMKVKSGSSGNWVSYNSIPGAQLYQFVTDNACYGKSSVMSNNFYLGGDGTEETGCD